MENNKVPNSEGTQFPPGHSGNPNGRPKGHITTFLQEFGNSDELVFTITKTSNGTKSESTARLSTNGTQTINQAIAARLLQMALAGDIKAIKEILNRTEGRVPQPLNIGGQSANPMRVVTYMPDNGRRKQQPSPSNIPADEPPTDSEIFTREKC
ncbi:DUF5681 domain-containing protein [Spirosoma litoris]